MVTPEILFGDTKSYVMIEMDTWWSFRELLVDYNDRILWNNDGQTVPLDPNDSTELNGPDIYRNATNIDDAWNRVTQDLMNSTIDDHSFDLFDRTMTSWIRTIINRNTEVRSTGMDEVDRRKAMTSNLRLNNYNMVVLWLHQTYPQYHLTIGQFEFEDYLPASEVYYTSQIEALKILHSLIPDHIFLNGIDNVTIIDENENDSSTNTNATIQYRDRDVRYMNIDPKSVVRGASTMNEVWARVGQHMVSFIESQLTVNPVAQQEPQAIQQYVQERNLWMDKDGGRTIMKKCNCAITCLNNDCAKFEVHMRPSLADAKPNALVERSCPSCNTELSLLKCSAKTKFTCKDNACTTQHTGSHSHGHYKGYMVSDKSFRQFKEVVIANRSLTAKQLVVGTTPNIRPVRTIDSMFQHLDSTSIYNQRILALQEKYPEHFVMADIVKERSCIVFVLLSHKHYKNYFLALFCTYKVDFNSANTMLGVIVDFYQAQRRGFIEAVEEYATSISSTIAESYLKGYCMHFMQQVDRVEKNHLLVSPENRDDFRKHIAVVRTTEDKETFERSWTHPRNALQSQCLERTTAIHTTIQVLHNLFVAHSDIMKLG
ncbi:hypothetical protein DFQ30_000312, partial [Apophysomyces sp. BC1015]